MVSPAALTAPAPIPRTMRARVAVPTGASSSSSSSFAGAALPLQPHHRLRRHGRHRRRSSAISVGRSPTMAAIGGEGNLGDMFDGIGTLLGVGLGVVGLSFIAGKGGSHEFLFAVHLKRCPLASPTSPPWSPSSSSSSVRRIPRPPRALVRSKRPTDSTSVGRSVSRRLRLTQPRACQMGIQNQSPQSHTHKNEHPRYGLIQG